MLKKHKEIDCPMRPDVCPHCGKEVPSQQMQVGCKDIFQFSYPVTTASHQYVIKHNYLLVVTKQQSCIRYHSSSLYVVFSATIQEATVNRCSKLQYLPVPSCSFFMHVHVSISSFSIIDKFGSDTYLANPQ